MTILIWDVYLHWDKYAQLLKTKLTFGNIKAGDLDCSLGF